MKRFISILGFCLIGLFIIIGVRYTYIKVTYPKVLFSIEAKRLGFAKSYQLATSDIMKEKIISQTRQYLHEVLSQEIFPAWYGTPWSFYGNAEHPLEGCIACGAFVENALRNCGFIVDKKLSAQPSEYIIKNLIGCDNNIERFSNIHIDTFCKKVKQMGEGIFIVGLDNHVGFFYILKDKYRFIHSHGYLCVLPEFPAFSPILRRSKYRVVGKLFDRIMIEKWLLKRPFSLEHDYFNQNN